MNPTEDEEQAAVVQYLELLGAKFTAIPNSTYTTSWKQKTKNTRTGLRAGFPDMVIILNHKFFCLEMKRRKGGRLSPEQEAWIIALHLAGVKGHVAHGFDEAKAIIDMYKR